MLLACSSGESDAPEGPSLKHEDPVVPALFFSDGEGSLVDESTPERTAVYRALPGQPDIAPIFKTDGTALTWGETLQATGTARLSCEEDGTRLRIEAKHLLPEGVYTGWLALFERPGFASAGLDATLAISPVGPTDGSESILVADARGRASLETVVPRAKATVPFVSGEPEIPSCLLDAFEVHVVLAYHLDGKTCGDNPCEVDQFVEHLAWIVVEGDAR
jgi:hypothetical protein